MRRIQGVLLVVVLAATTASGASAARPASDADSAAVVAAWAIDHPCIAVEVSSLNARWARATAGCTPASEADAVGLFRRTGDGWERRAVGTTERWFDCKRPAAPFRVMRDLRLCSPGLLTEECGESRTGWLIYAYTRIGARWPHTTCRLARAVFRAARARQPLPWRFPLRVLGQRLQCRVFESPVAEIRCQNRKRRVILRHL